MKDELNCSYNGGGVVYLLQSVAIHFNLTVRDNTLRFGCQNNTWILYYERRSSLRWNFSVLT